VIAPQRLYLTSDSRVVGEGDPAAAFLLAAEGRDVPAGYVEAAAAYLNGDKPEPEPDPEPEKPVRKPRSKK